MLIGQQNYVASAPAVTTIGSTFRHKFFAPKTNAATPTAASLCKNFYAINKHKSTYSIPCRTNAASGRKPLPKSGVKSLCFLCDRRPAKFFFGAFASSFSEFFAQLGIGHELIDPCREVPRKFLRICWLERALFPLLKRKQKSGFSIDNYFFDAAYCTRYHRRFTGHRFQINDAKRFVDGWTTKHGRVRVKFGCRFSV